MTDAVSYENPYPMTKKEPSPADKRRGQRLRELRKSVGLDITELAKMLGISRRTLQAWLIELNIPRPRAGR